MTTTLTREIVDAHLRTLELRLVRVNSWHASMLGVSHRQGASTWGEAAGSDTFSARMTEAMDNYVVVLDQMRTRIGGLAENLEETARSMELLDDDIEERFLRLNEKLEEGAPTDPNSYAPPGGAGGQAMLVN